MVNLLKEEQSRNTRQSADEYHTGRVLTHLHKRTPLLYGLVKISRVLRKPGFTFDPTPVRFDFRPLIPDEIQQAWALQNTRLNNELKLGLECFGYSLAESA